MSLTCECRPTYGQSCDACDGTAAQFEPDPTGEPCRAFETPGELCAHRADTGSPYCTEHQWLDIDLPRNGAAA